MASTIEAFVLLMIHLGAGPNIDSNGEDFSSKAKNIDAGAVQYQLGDERRIYEVPIAYAYVTTVWFPIDCYEPSIGDPDVVAVLYDSKIKANRRFNVTPKTDQPGATTNVTFSCAGGQFAVLKLNQVAPEKAVLSVEFKTDPKESARVRAAVESARKEFDTLCQAQLSEMTEKAAEDNETQLLHRMLRRISGSDDVEWGRKDLVAVRVFRQVLIGQRAYLQFEIENRTRNDVRIREVKVFDERRGNVLDDIALLVEKPRIEPGDTVAGIVAFNAPDDSRAFKMAVYEDGPRVIEIDDIEL